MIDIVEILTHWYAGRSRNELAASSGVDRKTLRKVHRPARAAGIEPGGVRVGRRWPRRTGAAWRPAGSRNSAPAPEVAGDVLRRRPFLVGQPPCPTPCPGHE
jgi:hypothetical protein